MDLSSYPADPPALDLDPRFTAVRLRRGYDMREVDDLLDRLVRAIRRGDSDLATRHLPRTALTRTRWREGYRCEEVDAWLAVAERHLARR